MSLEICPHTDEHKPVIWNVFQFYCYETSIEDGYDLEENGLYSLSAGYFGRYWTDPRWRAHLLRWNGVIAGFALIEASEALASAQELADLFILKKFRRKGIARDVALHFMAERTIPWTVITFHEADSAQAFWRSMFTNPLLQPARQMPDPDGRDATVHVLEPNVAAAPGSSRSDASHVVKAKLQTALDEPAHPAADAMTNEKHP